MNRGFRHAICNEVYQGWDFAAAAASIRRAGYTGIEIAPFTLAESPAGISPDRRGELRRIMESEGLAFAGLHWLMVAPKGLHVTTPDRTLRERGWLHIRQLIDLCADLGDGGVMVFGSPQQRCTTGGASREQATANFIEGLADVAGHAAERGVTILVEALPRAQCDVINSIEEALAVVRQVGSPAVSSMFDTHNAIDETEPHSVLVDRHYASIRHIHVNEMDGRHPGAGDYDFKPLLGVLGRLGYTGWISLEAFDFSPGAEAIAAGSLRYLEAQIGLLSL
jgi:sugar phosphate isomerase/epimerase